MAAEFKRVQASAAALNSQLAAMTGPKGTLNPTGWNAANKAIAANSAMFRAAASSSGMFETSQMRVASATDNYIKKLEKQKITFRDMWRDGGSTMKAAYREQLRLQQMVVRELPGTDASGRKMYDLVVPTEVHKSWDTLGKRIGFVRENLAAASIQVQNWGKNTQWAGRQLMVGFTYPLAAFGAAAGVLAYQVDEQMTRIEKVYDAATGNIESNVTAAAQKEIEMNNLRTESWRTVEIATANYGAAATETLAVQAELAAQGVNGSELQQATQQVMRIATLGEFPAEEAVKSMTALVATMGMTAEEAGDAFNYMNAVENATSLATQDFAKAIPIALGPMKQMGGSLKDLSMLLVAMRERGIEAGEGANAIKSMMQRLYRPSKQVREEWEQLAGVDLVQMVRDSGGKIMEILPQIQQAVEGMSRPQRVQLLGGLFGTYQVARISAMLDGIEKINEAGTQTNRVFELNKKSVEDYAATAEAETRKIQESVYGRFRVALNTLKNELAAAGVPFVEAATTVLSAISDIFKAFQNAPDFVKDFAKWSAIILAVVGPLTMLVGLSANFIGTIGRMAVSFLGLFTNFKLLNKESAVSRLALALAERGFLSAGTAASIQTAQMTTLIEALTMADKASVDSAKAAGLVQESSIRASEALRAEAFNAEYAARAHRERIAAAQAAGAVVPSSWQKSAAQADLDAVVYHGMADAEVEREKNAPAGVDDKSAKNSAVIAGNTEKTRHFMHGAAIQGGIFAAAMAATLLSSNETVSTFANFAMLAAVVGPAIWGIGAAVTTLPLLWHKATVAVAAHTVVLRANMTAAVGAAAAQTTVAGAMATGLARGGAALAAFLGPIGLITVGLTAIAGTAWLLKKRLDAGKDTLSHMYQDAEKLSEIIGYTASEPLSRSIDEAGNSTVNLMEKVRQFGSAYGDVVAEIQDARNEADMLRVAMSQGMKVINTGGTEQQAIEATKIALAAATSIAEAKEIMLKFKGIVDFSDVDKAIEQLKWTANDVLKDVGNYEGAGWWDQFTFDDAAIADRNELKEAGTIAGETLADAYNKAASEGISTSGIEEEAQKQLDKINRQIEAARDAVDNNPFTTDDDDRLNSLIELRDNYLRGFLEGAPQLEKAMENISGTTSLLEAMETAGLQISPENWKIFRMSGNTGVFDAIHAFVGDAEEGFEDAGGAVDVLSSEEREAAREAKRLAAAGREVKEAFQGIDFVGAMRGAWENVVSNLGDAASEDFNNRMENALDSYRAGQQARLDSMQSAHENATNAMERRQEAATDAFEKRWERRRAAVEKHFDKRINAINKEIEAENRQEENRKRIFDAEVARIQRMRDLQNFDIEFNVALDEGNLDEAARIQNDALASQEEWDLEDETKRAERASERRIRKLEKELDKVEELKDRRIKAMEEVEERERKALDRMQERQSRALEARQEAAQNALEKEVASNIKGQEAIWENRKEKMDKAIEYFKSFTPKNEKELQAHIDRTREKYGIFNDNTKEVFDKTSKQVGSMLAHETAVAANSIRTDIKWELIGNEAARRMLTGALGMNVGEFRYWMTSGKWPKGASGKMKKMDYNGTTFDQKPKSPGPAADIQTQHTGGWIYDGGSNRKGVARTQKGLGPGERMVRAREKEFLVNEHSASKYGPLLEAINAGTFDRQTDPQGRPVLGGSGFSMGFAGLMGSALRQFLVNGLQTGMTERHNEQVDKVRAKRARRRARMAAMAGGAWGNYSLPGVKPWVLEAANYLGGKYNIGTILGVGQRSNVSDHPLGLALDFMTADSRGDKLAAEVIKRHRDLDAKYMIWKQRITGGSRPWGTWEQMEDRGSPTANHFDHVHLSFLANGDTGDLPKPKGGGGAAGVYVPGAGGRRSPIKYPVSRDIHDTSTGYPAVDISAPSGTPIYAVGSGRISESTDLKGHEPRAPHGGLGYRSYGRYMKLDLDSGPTVLYAHLSRRGLNAGAKVQGGSRIGFSGNTGYSFGPHLHFGSSDGNPFQFTSLAKGAENIKWDNTIANLHKGEMVLTDDLSAQLKQGIGNLANGVGNQYNVNVNVLEPGASANDIANTVIRTLKWTENRKPRSRS